jgi:transposase-like protein
MVERSQDDLWRDFPKTATEFEARFATEEDCRAYWIEARWGGKPTCARCGSTYVWPIRGGTTFECRDCDHQTSLTAGTVLEKTHKPLKVWFRAVFEISTRRTGISAKDLQRILGFGSYKTAWTWLHKLRAALVRPEREPLAPLVQMDEALVGGKGGPHKKLVLVAAETDGRVRLAHAETNDKTALRRRTGRARRKCSDRRARQLRQRQPGRSTLREDRSDQGRAARKRQSAGLPLDHLAAEALASGHACGLGIAEASAGLSRRIRLPPQPAQDQGCRADRRARHRATRGAPAADHAITDRRHATLPNVSLPGANGIGIITT